MGARGCWRAIEFCSHDNFCVSPPGARLRLLGGGRQGAPPPDKRHGPPPRPSRLREALPSDVLLLVLVVDRELAPHIIRLEDAVPAQHDVALVPD